MRTFSFRGQRGSPLVGEGWRRARGGRGGEGGPGVEEEVKEGQPPGVGEGWRSARGGRGPGVGEGVRWGVRGVEREEVRGSGVKEGR